jgi:hypothetical protein
VDDAQFWSIIEAGGPESFRDRRRQLDAVRERLRQFDPAELVAFHLTFNRKMDDADHWDVKAAGRLMNSSFSDDGYEYFRAWLVSRGRRAYEAAVRDADSLAEVASDGWEAQNEELWGAAQGVYREKTGEHMVVEFTWSETRGEEWDYDSDEELTRRLPRLATVCGVEPEEAAEPPEEADRPTKAKQQQPKKKPGATKAKQSPKKRRGK